MNDTMGIRRSREKGMYLLRDGESLWRIKENGMIDCTTHGPCCAFEFLAQLQQWKTPSRRLFQSYPLQAPPTD